MSYQVVLTDRAARDLEAAYLWIAQHAPEAANRWYNGFLDALDTLSSNPDRCGLAPEGRRIGGVLRQLVYGRHRNYRAIFTIRHDTVTVLHIRHAARREASPEDMI